MKAALFGWLSEEGIPTFIYRHRAVVSTVQFVLVRVVDSSYDVGGMRWARARSTTRPDWAVSQNPLVVSGVALLELVDSDETFFGFDEIWLSRTAFTAFPPPEVSLVAPVQLESVLESAIETYLLSPQSVVGFGDGYGLNFAGNDPGLMIELGLVEDHQIQDPIGMQQEPSE